MTIPQNSIFNWIMKTIEIIVYMIVVLEIIDADSTVNNQTL